MKCESRKRLNDGTTVSNCLCCHLLKQDSEPVYVFTSDPTSWGRIVRRQNYGCFVSTFRPGYVIYQNDQKTFAECRANTIIAIKPRRSNPEIPWSQHRANKQKERVAPSEHLSIDSHYCDWAIEKEGPTWWFVVLASPRLRVCVSQGVRFIRQALFFSSTRIPHGANSCPGVDSLLGKEEGGRVCPSGRTDVCLPAHIITACRTRTKAFEINLSSPDIGRGSQPSAFSACHPEEGRLSTIYDDEASETGGMSMITPTQGRTTVQSGLVTVPPEQSKIRRRLSLSCREKESVLDRTVGRFVGSC